MGGPKFLGAFPYKVPVASQQVVWTELSHIYPIAGASSIVCALHNRITTGDAAVIPAAMLFEATELKADTPSAASGSYQSTNGTVTRHATDLSTTTDRFLGQTGIFTKLDGGTTRGYAVGTVSVWLVQCMQEIGARTIEVPAALATSTPSYFVLGRVAAPGADKVRAALVCTDANDLEYLLYVRGVLDPDSPGTWTALNGGTWTSITDGNTGTCHADAAVSGVTPANYTQLEVMLALRLKSGGSAPTGIVRVAAAMSYA